MLCPDAPCHGPPALPLPRSPSPFSLSLAPCHGRRGCRHRARGEAAPRPPRPAPSHARSPACVPWGHTAPPSPVVAALRRTGGHCPPWHAPPSSPSFSLSLPCGGAANPARAPSSAAAWPGHCCGCLGAAAPARMPPGLATLAGPSGCSGCRCCPPSARPGSPLQSSLFVHSVVPLLHSWRLPGGAVSFLSSLFVPLQSPLVLSSHLYGRSADSFCSYKKVRCFPFSLHPHLSLRTDAPGDARPVECGLARTGGDRKRIRQG